MGKAKKFGIGVLIVIGGFVALGAVANLTTTDEQRAQWEEERKTEEQKKILEQQNEQSLSKYNIKNPKSANEWFEKGRELHKQDNYDEAIIAFDQAITLDSDHANAWAMKGNAIGRLGNYAAAINAFDQAIKINPNHENAWYNKGYALSQLGNYAAAINAFDQAIKIDPYFEDAKTERNRAIKLLSSTGDKSQSNSNIGFDPQTVESAKKNIPSAQSLLTETLSQCKNVKSYSDYQIFTLAIASLEYDLTQTMTEWNLVLSTLELEGYDKHPEVGPLIKETRNLATVTSQCLNEMINRYG